MFPSPAPFPREPDTPVHAGAVPCFADAALATLGGAATRLTARLSARSGGAGLARRRLARARLPTSALAGWAGAWSARKWRRRRKAMFVAMALAAGRRSSCCSLRPGRSRPSRPARSARSRWCLVAGQLTDAARFFVFALAGATGAPALAAAGGALGSGAVLTAAWAMGGEWEARLPLRAIRLGVGGAVRRWRRSSSALSARGLIG